MRHELLISVKVKFFGFFIELAGRKELDIEADNTVTVMDLINKIEGMGNVDFKKGVVDSETQKLRDDVMLVLNEKDITNRQGLDTALSDKDELQFYAISLGG
jgi:molybdopterin converting factor small subunit